MTRTQPAEPSEALARRYAKDFEWRLAAGHAKEWQIDQPFATDAAALGSWYAIEAGDYDLASSFCDLGLVANPGDAALLNNRAFASACRWDLLHAAQDLAAVNFRDGESANIGCALATAGFIALRSNDLALGRALYNKSMQLFIRHRMSEQAARAAMNLAAEEKRVKSAEVEAAMKRADTLVRQAKSAEVDNTWLRIQADQYLPGDAPTSPPPERVVDQWLYQGLPDQLTGLGDTEASA